MQPKETKNLEVTIRWKNTEDNLGAKTAKAEIVETQNKANFKDIDQKDDLTTVTIVIGIKTGEVVSIAIIMMLTISYTIAGYMIITSIKRIKQKPDIKDIKFLNK